MSINYYQPRSLYPTKPSIKIDGEIFHDKHNRGWQKILTGIIHAEEKGRWLHSQGHERQNFMRRPDREEPGRN